jgi:hypothetical protein
MNVPRRAMPFSSISTPYLREISWFMSEMSGNFRSPSSLSHAL